MKTFIQRGENITAPAPAAVTSGAGVLIGALFGIANGDAESGADVVLSTTGVFEMPNPRSRLKQIEHERGKMRESAFMRHTARPQRVDVIPIDSFAGRGLPGVVLDVDRRTPTPLMSVIDYRGAGNNDLSALSGRFRLGVELFRRVNDVTGLDAAEPHALEVLHDAKKEADLPATFRIARSCLIEGDYRVRSVDALLPEVGFDLRDGRDCLRFVSSAETLVNGLAVDAAAGVGGAVPPDDLDRHSSLLIAEI